MPRPHHWTDLLGMPDELSELVARLARLEARIVELERRVAGAPEQPKRHKAGKDRTT